MHKTIKMNILIDNPCTTDCPRFCSGTCPFEPEEQEEKCPLWKTVIEKHKYIIDAVSSLNKYFSSYPYILSSVHKIDVTYDHGVLIIHLDMILYEIDIKWKIPDIVDTLPGNGTKADYIFLGAKQIIDRFLKKKEDD